MDNQTSQSQHRIPVLENELAVGNTRGVIPTGTTAFYTMIGTPIIQVKSPLLYNRYFADHGMDAVMIAMNVPSDQVNNHFKQDRKSVV